MLYAMSDIHGYLSAFQKAMEKIDLSGDNKLVLLGDYIDYGPESGQVLRYIYELQQQYDAEKVIVLRGNHEEMFLEWLDTYRGPNAGKPDEYGLIPYNDWLSTDRDYATFRTFFTKEQWESFQQIKETETGDSLNAQAAQMILSTNAELMKWLRKLPYFYETEKQIFVHAGIDEEAGDLWKLATEEYMFVSKFPATKGKFYKDIIAGHIGTATASGIPGYQGVYFDGQSHYYIDGSVSASGSVPILTYDEKTEKYSELKGKRT